MYIFLFAFSFLFSSDPFAIRWKGLNINLSLCSTIKELTNDIECCPKDVFKKFPFPSKKSKNGQYLRKLFNPDFNYSDAETQLLVNLAVDRKALGFDQEIFLDPLLKVAINKGLLTFSSMTFVLNDDDNKRRVEEYVKITRNYFNVSTDCFQYLKTDMSKRLPDYFKSIYKKSTIKSKPEWNELITHDPATFFTCLIEANANCLELDSLDPDTLTQFFKQYKKLNRNYNVDLTRLTISNSSMKETVFELQTMFTYLTLKNCFNLALGETDVQKNDLIKKIILKDYYSSWNESSTRCINCKLDEPSFQACQDISHSISVYNCLRPLILLIGLSWSIFDICRTIRSSDFELRMLHFVFSLVINGLLRSKNFDFSYFPFSDLRFSCLRIVCAIRIAYDLVPLVLKNSCIFPFRLLSGLIIIGSFAPIFLNDYDWSKKKMCRLVKNEFGLFTKYAFLDRLCKLYFRCGDPCNKG